jgi:CubicO group peptidase (beta-lactamase class C family)
MGLARTLPEIMTKAGVPGLSYAVLEEGKVAWVGSVGVRSTESQEPVNDDTVFAAASLSKPVFAYLVMLLTQDGGAPRRASKLCRPGRRRPYRGDHRSACS